MHVIRKLLFSIADFLLPDSPHLMQKRGKLARLILGLRGAKWLGLGRGVKFNAGYGQIEIGDRTYIYSGCVLQVMGTGRIKIGNDCFIFPECQFWSWVDADVLIGDRVWIATQSLIWTGSHEIGDSSQRAGEGTQETIDVGSGSWLGVRTTVFKSVGPGSIINAGSLVTKPIEANVLAQGVPAKSIRQLD